MKKNYAEGGAVDDNTWLEKMAKKWASKNTSLTTDVRDDTAAHDVENSPVPQKTESDNGTLVGFRDTMKKAQGYDDGGTVEPSFQDKLSQVMQAMGMGAKSALGPLGPTGAIANAVTPPAAQMAQSPALPAVANAALGTNLPVPPTLPPPAPVMPQNAPPSAPQPAPAAPAQAPQTDKPASTSATDILGKLTDGDNGKMSALLSQLRDQDKRNQFAQALAVIGDTFGNMGQAKAGQTPSGITTPGLIQSMGEKNKAAALENINQQLLSDPKSQTSQMAQMTLMQAMGVKPGDPRAAHIQSLPALAITQLMPQMNDAVKAASEREKNALQGKQFGTENELKREQIAVEEANAQRQLSGTLATASNDALKNLSPLNPANTAARGAAQRNLTNILSGGQGGAQPITATNKMGHKIVSTDGGKTWKPLQ